MSVDQKIIVDGHVSRPLLREFAKDPDGFDEDTVEAIWEHLDDCEACVEDYETIREGGHPAKRDTAEETPPVPESIGEGAIESDAFDPEDLKSAKVEETEQDDSHINGLMPVGDDPARSGLPDEYRNGDRPAKVKMEMESSIDAARDDESKAEEASDDAGESEDGEDDNRRPVLKAPEIEGLITGEVPPLEEETDRLETESAVEAGERITQEDPKQDTAAEDGGEASQDSEIGEIDLDIEVPDIDDSAPEEDGAGEDEVPFIDPAVEEKPARRPAHPDPAVLPKVPAAKKKSEPLEDTLNSALAFLVRPRNAIIFGGALLLIVAAIVTAVVITGDKKERLIAGWEPLDVIETSVPLQEVIVRKMYRGRIPRASGPDVTLDFRGIDRLVIAVDLDFIKGKSSPHDVIVRNPAGMNVYQEPIPQLYLDDGRFFLRLVPNQFEEGQLYKLELVTYHADESILVVAESVFDVSK